MNVPDSNATDSSTSQSPGPTSQRNWRVWILIGLLLVVHAGLAFDCARKMSVTHDEYWHLPVGLLNLKTGRFNYDNLNPPLVRMWAALPLLAVAEVPQNVDNLDANGHGDAFLAANREEFHYLFTLGRGMIVLLSVLTGLTLAVWARELFGDASAVLTALLWSASPTVLMNASLVTTDLGATFFFVVTLYAVWKHARQPTWARAGWLGLILGLAQLAKFTSILLFPLAIVSWLVFRVRNREVDAKPAGSLFAQWIVVLMLSLLVWNAGFLFRGSLTSLKEYEFHSKSLASASQQLSALNSLPIPLPRDYLMGLDRQRRIMEQEHPVYLDGEWVTVGFPHYYLMAVWYKLSHALQLLAIVSSICLLLPGREPRQGRVQIVLLLPMIALPLIASGSAMQLGIRYLLPMFPFLILFAGQSGRWLCWNRYRARSAIITLLSVIAMFSVRHHPHHLAYFNELAGGPGNGHNHLLDSNLDWGQDLRALGEYLREKKIDNPGIAYFGSVPPSSLGIDYHLPPAGFAQPGWYAVSTNFVQGRPHFVRKSDNSYDHLQFDQYGYFRFFEPTKRIGYSIRVYHIPEHPRRL